jgi:hypothetical protein
MADKAIIGTPHFNLAEADQQAKSHMAENYGAAPWETYQTKNEDVRAVYNKVFCVSKDKVPIFVTRASAVLPHSADKLFQTYWDPALELKWNVSTVSSMQVLENHGNRQLVYQQHKTLSAASAKRDLLFERTWEKDSQGTYWIVAASHPNDDLKPVAKDYVRAKVVFSGVQIKPVQGKNAAEVTTIWCVDFCGWLHAKFIEQEFGNVALRISRLGKNVPTGPAPAAHQPERQQMPSRPEPVNAPKGAGFCPKCGTARGEGKFCGNCGELLSSALGSVI